MNQISDLALNELEQLTRIELSSTKPPSLRVKSICKLCEKSSHNELNSLADPLRFSDQLEVLGLIVHPFAWDKRLSHLSSEKCYLRVIEKIKNPTPSHLMSSNSVRLPSVFIVEDSGADNLLGSTINGRICVNYPAIIKEADRLRSSYPHGHPFHASKDDVLSYTIAEESQHFVFSMY